MKLIRIVRRPGRHLPPDLDLRTSGGRPLPF